VNLGVEVCLQVRVLDVEPFNIPVVYSREKQQNAYRLPCSGGSECLIIINVLYLRVAACDYTATILDRSIGFPSNLECKFGLDWFKFIVDLINTTTHFESVTLFEPVHFVI
jgi:hypothetical protein